MWMVALYRELWWGVASLIKFKWVARMGAPIHGRDEFLGP